MVYQAEDRARLRRQHSDLAIQLAIQGRWDDAVKVNRAIIDAFPQDAEAYNRLGKALAEIGNYAAARDAYSRCLELDPHNAIARKNLNRLATLEEVEAPRDGAQQKLAPDMFIEEMGKTGVTSLIEWNPQVAVRLTAGDRVYLRADGSSLLVDTAQGELVGKIEPKLAQRLLRLMKGGNQYVAAITNIAEREVRVFIRETYQDAKQVGKLSFPATSAGDSFRPYVKERLVRQDGTSEEYYEEADSDDWEPDSGDTEEVSVFEVSPEAAREDFEPVDEE